MQKYKGPKRPRRGSIYYHSKSYPSCGPTSRQVDFRWHQERLPSIRLYQPENMEDRERIGPNFQNIVEAAEASLQNFDSWRIWHLAIERWLKDYALQELDVLWKFSVKREICWVLVIVISKVFEDIALARTTLEIPSFHNLARKRYLRGKAVLLQVFEWNTGKRKLASVPLYLICTKILATTTSVNNVSMI